MIVRSLISPFSLSTSWSSTIISRVHHCNDFLPGLRFLSRSSPKCHRNCNQNVPCKMQIWSNYFPAFSVPTVARIQNSHDGSEGPAQMSDCLGSPLWLYFLLIVSYCILAKSSFYKNHPVLSSLILAAHGVPLTVVSSPLLIFMSINSYSSLRVKLNLHLH